MTDEILADTAADDLCQLGIRIFGDIKTILHHAKENPPTNTIAPDTTKSPTTITTFMKTPAAKPPIILHDMKRLQFCKFRTDWNVFKRITNLPDNQIYTQLYNACDETVQINLVNTTTDFFSLIEYDLLNTFEATVTKKTNPAVHQLTFSSLFQSEGESVTGFVVQLKSISPDCEFPCPGCYKDLQPIHNKDQLIWGLYNEKLQPDILAKASHLIQLEDIIL